MNQILVHFGPFILPAYGFFIGLALVLGMLLGELRARQIGLPRFAILDLAFVVSLAGIVGAELFHFAFPGVELLGSSGRSTFGGLFGGAVAGVIFARWKGLPVLPSADCLILYLPLQQALGRVGCWFYGCCHGPICSPSFPLATAFPRVDAGGGQLAGSPAFIRHLTDGLIDSGAGHSLPVYPTQLLSALLSVGVFLTLRASTKKTAIVSRSGAIVCLYLMIGGAARFLEEFFRDHNRYGNLVTHAQMISFMMVAAGALGMYYLFSRGPATIQSMPRKSAGPNCRSARL